MNAPTGRKISVSVSENAICASDLPNSFAIAVRHITTRKKSNASSVQPRNPAVTAAPWSERGAGAAEAAGGGVGGAKKRGIWRPSRPPTPDSPPGGGAPQKTRGAAAPAGGGAPTAGAPRPG